VAGALAAAAGEPRTIRDRVFSQAQVDHGRRIFRSICSNCHEIEEFTDPGAYLAEMDGKAVWEVFEFVRTKMPDDDPGSLRPAEYAAVLSYLFERAGAPVGTLDLPLEREPLEAITIVGPRPPRG
jgi:mono/diheme cytochrome c family protein